MLRDWAEVQFRELGRRDAAELAVTLLAGVQGAALLADTFRDPAMTRQVRGSNAESTPWHSPQIRAVIAANEVAAVIARCR